MTGAEGHTHPGTLKFSLCDAALADPMSSARAQHPRTLASARHSDGNDSTLASLAAPQSLDVCAEALKAILLHLRSTSTSTEFCSLAHQLSLSSFPCQAAIQHRDKNRYSDILPYDYNAVKVSGRPSYINASMIRDCCRGEAATHIATQGPLDATVVDFWKMVLETNVKAVVMLADFYENGRPKCAHYFPESPGQELRFGKITVRTVQQRTVGLSIIVRSIQVLADGAAPHIVLHYKYDGWPDFGVPSNTEGLRALSRHISTCKADSSPVVVHCSAGVGRTGTFCAFDIIMDRLRSLPKGSTAATVAAIVDVPATVLQLRQQRMGMVQTPQQYQFCYQCLVDELESLTGR